MRNNEILSTESFIVDESYLSFDEFFSITLRQDSPDLGHVTPKLSFGVFSNNCVVMIILIYAIFHSSFPFEFFLSFAPFFLNCLWFEESSIVSCTNSCLRQTQINVALSLSSLFPFPLI